MIYIILNFDKKEVLDITFSYFFAKGLRLLYRICYKDVFIIPIDKYKFGSALVAATMLFDEAPDVWKGNGNV